MQYPSMSFSFKQMSFNVVLGKKKNKYILLAVDIFRCNW